ncbi:MAG: acyltransferase [Candidatus Latescibacteria bacterium]|jgi:acetyltransferase-like isoleucine patch superfamily enzyme|nr:acyltransferase [Candidatus Latescibacterota bacterium]
MNISTRIWIMEILSTVVRLTRSYWYRIQGYRNIDRTAILEKQLNLDRVNPQGIHIGKNSLIASRVTILSHDHVKRDKSNPRMPFMIDTYIGKNCFIGIGVIILSGVKIGDEVVIGAGSVVTKNIPSNVVAAGNPARVIKENIHMTSKATIVS